MHSIFAWTIYSNVCTNSVRTHVNIPRFLVFPVPIFCVSYKPKFHIIGLITSFWVSLTCQEHNKLVTHHARKLVDVLLQLLPSHSCAEHKAQSLTNVWSFVGLESQNFVCSLPIECQDFNNNLNDSDIAICMKLVLFSNSNNVEQTWNFAVLKYFNRQCHSTISNSLGLCSILWWQLLYALAVALKVERHPL